MVEKTQPEHARELKQQIIQLKRANLDQEEKILDQREQIRQLEQQLSEKDQSKVPSEYNQQQLAGVINENDQLSTEGLDDLQVSTESALQVSKE